MADVDTSKLSPEELAFFNKYGKLKPTKKKTAAQRLAGGRQYFDSADYSMQMAGKGQGGGASAAPVALPPSVADTAEEPEEEAAAEE